MIPNFYSLARNKIAGIVATIGLVGIIASSGCSAKESPLNCAEVPLNGASYENVLMNVYAREFDDEMPYDEFMNRVTTYNLHRGNLETVIVPENPNDGDNSVSTSDGTSVSYYSADVACVPSK